VVCEDSGHFTTVTRLIDDTLLEEVDWLDGVLEASRVWRGKSETERWYKYDPADANDVRRAIARSFSSSSFLDRLFVDHVSPSLS